MNKEDFERSKDKLTRSKKVIVLTGAGISAESGVPFEQLSSAQMVERDLPMSTLSVAPIAEPLRSSRSSGLKKCCES